MCFVVQLLLSLGLDVAGLQTYMYYKATKPSSMSRTSIVVSHIYTPPSRISPPYIFSQSSCTGIFISRIGPPNHGHSTKMIFVETPSLSSSRSPWQCKNEASVHRTAKEFTVDRRRVREWCQSATAHWKDNPAECLENTSVYAVANLCQSILTIKFQGLGGQQN